MVAVPSVCGLRCLRFHRRFQLFLVSVFAVATLPLNTFGATPPVITMVSPIVSQQFQTITITGSGFGTLQAYNGNSSYIRITDLKSGWSAGNSESCGPIYGCPDPVSLAISSWTDSQIIIIGFTGGYGNGKGQYTLNPGDHTELYIWNPRTDVGPATYENVVQAATGGSTGTSSSCASSSGTTGTGSVCVTMVSPIVSQQFQTIIISGSGFGTLQAYNGNSSYIRITDLTSGWSAGNSESCGPIYGCPDPVSLTISSWTDSQIIIVGFTGGYGNGKGQYTLNPGDHTELYIWNPRTDVGPATYENVVQAATGGSTGTSSSCASSSGTTGIGSVCVTMVGPIVSQQFQTITISGSGFGSLQAYNGNSSYIRITDLTSGWSAGNSESCGPIYGCPDPVSLTISSWTDSQIVIIGFTGGYGNGKGQYALNLGDHTELYIWNPQTDVGPATYESVVQASASTSTALTLSPATLPPATLDFAYSQQLTAGGGTAPYSFSIVSGSPPTGLSFSSGGFVGGTPTQASTASFIVQVKDSASNVAQFSYTLAVGTPSNCTYNVNPPSASLQTSGGPSGFGISTQIGCVANILVEDSWIHVTSPASPTSGGTVTLSIDANDGPSGRASVVGVMNAAGAIVGTYAVTQVGVAASVTGSTFVPLPPCRVMDTRTGNGFTGEFGPPSFTAGQTRTVNPIQSGCNVPAGAVAYATNVTLLPTSPGKTNAVTIYPSDEVLPRYITASAGDGNIVANAAIIRAGATNGAIDVYSTDNIDILIDISGYFASGASNLTFYPLTPCRVVDTRAATRAPGPFGGPSMAAGEIRQYQFPASPYCSIPSGATAYSMTITAAPVNSGPLFYLTAWPGGVPTVPTVSTLNSFDGRIIGNEAIVPAGTDGSIQIYTSNPTDFFIDVNGYFAANDGKTGLSYYPVTQCTAANSGDELYSGAYGGPSYPGGARSIAVPGSPFCASIPTGAVAYAVDVTANPYGNVLGYVTLYPTGSVVPQTSMLNDFQRQIVTNSAIVPAGPNGSIDVLTNGGPTDIQLMISGYFSR